MRVFTKNDIIKNPTIVRKDNLMIKGNSHSKDHLMNHEHRVIMDGELKLYTLNTQDMNKGKYFNIKIVSVNKLLNFILLQVLLVLCILCTFKDYDINKQEKTQVSTCMCQEGKIGVLLLMVGESRKRILAEKKEEESELDGKQLITREEHKDRALDSSKVIKVVNEYKHMVEELKDKFFLHNREFYTFLRKMEEKKDILKMYAPDLLNKNESEDIHTAKILKYYTEYLNKNSKIKRLNDSLRHYETSFSYFQAAWEADNENDKNQYTEDGEYYNNLIKNFDPATYIIIQGRLEKLRVQLTLSSNIKNDSIFSEENSIINDALQICHKYMEFLNKPLEYKEISNSSYKRNLYNMEMALSTKIPEFYGLYKWKRVPRLWHNKKNK